MRAGLDIWCTRFGHLELPLVVRIQETFYQKWCTQVVHPVQVLFPTKLRVNPAAPILLKTTRTTVLLYSNRGSWLPFTLILDLPESAALDAEWFGKGGRQKPPPQSANAVLGLINGVGKTL